MKKIIKEITEMREQYYRHVKSWGRSDADKWWEEQLSIFLTQYFADQIVILSKTITKRKNIDY